MEKEKTPRIEYGYENRLIVKLIGKADYIKRHIILLRRLYSPQQMNFSPILENKGTDGFHCFINILMEEG